MKKEYKAKDLREAKKEMENILEKLDSEFKYNLMVSAPIQVRVTDYLHPNKYSTEASFYIPSHLPSYSKEHMTRMFPKGNVAKNKVKE